MKKDIFKKFKNLLNKECLSIINKISNKIDKPKISIFFDIYKCSLNYESTYNEYYYYEFYNLNEEERDSFITNSLNDKLIDKYNDKDYSIKLEDRGELYKIYKNYVNREYLDLREVSFKEFEEFISKKDKIICKSANSIPNKLEVINIDKSKLKNEYNILKIYNQIMKQEEYIIEEEIKQNDILNEIYSKSINSVRITTFKDNSSNVFILNEMLDIGRNDISDNINNDDLIALIDENGIIRLPAMDKKGRYFVEHPTTFKKIVGLRVPNIKKAEELAIKLARDIKNVRYITWNVAILNDKVALLSADTHPLVFQLKPTVSKSKIGLKNKYKKYMEF